jgi:hypothetical protein
MTGGTALSLALAVLIGLTLGALGGGGSVLTLPIFVFVAGIPAQEAVTRSDRSRCSKAHCTFSAMRLALGPLNSCR